MVNPYRILNLENEPADAELTQRALRRAGHSFDIQVVDTKPGFLRALEDYSPDLILCDYSLPGVTGLEALAIAQEVVPDTPVIIFSGAVSEEAAVACLKAGAVDYVLKDDSQRLPSAVEAALRSRTERLAKAEVEDALRESESRHRTLVESAPDAIVTVDGTGVIQSWNAAAEDMFGYSAAQMIGESLHRVIPERLRHDHDGHLAATAGTGKLRRHTMAVTGLRSDGLEFPAETSLSTVHVRGKPWFTAMIRDRTETVAARQAMEALSRQQELLLSSAGEGIVGLDADAIVTFANPVALSILRREATDCVGQPFHSLVHAAGDRAADAECPVLVSLRNGTAFRGELDFARSDGSHFPVAMSLTPMPEDGGRRGAVAVFEDITLRVAQEEALRASEAKYRGLVDDAPFGIYRSTRDGRFLSVNRALVEMLGYGSADELLSVDLERDIYEHPEDRGRLIEKPGGGDVLIGGDTTWLRKDGTPLPVRLSVRSIWGPGGQVDTFHGLVEDRSVRRLLEKQLLQAQKMEAVGQLTGGIAHGFNNILAVILLNSQLLIATLEQGGTVDVEDLVAIEDAAKRAAAVTGKLLGFSRQADLEPAPTRLDAMVLKLSSMLRTLLPESIELDLDLSKEPAPVEVDAGAVEQMLLSLVTNSREALPQGGHVALKVGELDLDMQFCRGHPGSRPGVHSFLEVSDNGIGMDAETLRRVFDPFFTTKAPGAGTGLGMAMVYGLTKQQGGFVQIESQLGAGTPTRLYFPRCE